MAATGFVNRWKGKIKADVLMLGPTFVNGPGAVASYSTAGTQTISNQNSVALVSGSSGLAVFTLPDPRPGVPLEVYVQPTSGIMLKAPAGVALDPSTNTVIKSTYNMMVTLIGISTVAYRIEGAFPGSTLGVAPASGITLSTTT